ncbi:MAG: class I SAM-dependent methyltransferase [Rubrivivax sp.]
MPEQRSGRALYDAIGSGYRATRRADPGIVGALHDHLGILAAGRYLDVGCGSGNYTVALAARGGEWTGIDPSTTMLAEASRAHAGVAWHLGEAGNLPFADGTFDGAIATLVIHHFKELRRPLQEVRRVLRSGRLVIFTAFPEQMQRYWLCHYFPRMLERSARTMPAEAVVRQALRSAGFTDVQVSPFQVTSQLQDLFLYSGKQRPELYLDAVVRANISSFATLCEESELAAGLEALAADLRTGAFEGVKRRYDGPGGDYAFVVADTGTTSRGAPELR